MIDVNIKDATNVVRFIQENSSNETRDEKTNIPFFIDKKILPESVSSEGDKWELAELKQDIPSFSLKQLEPFLYSHFNRAEGIVDALKNTGCFDERSWKEMDIDARKEALIDLNKQIAEIEGINPCDVSFEKLPSEYRGYQYDGKIVLNAELVEKPENMYQAIETLAHETYHQYQCEAVSNPSIHNSPAEVKEWEENLENYLDPEVYGFELYFEQPVERSAREFASEIKDGIIAQNTHDLPSSDSSLMA